MDVEGVEVDAIAMVTDVGPKFMVVAHRFIRRAIFLGTEVVGAVVAAFIASVEILQSLQIKV